MLFVDQFVPTDPMTRGEANEVGGGATNSPDSRIGVVRFRGRVRPREAAIEEDISTRSLKEERKAQKLASFRSFE